MRQQIREVSHVEELLLAILVLCLTASTPSRCPLINCILRIRWALKFGCAQLFGKLTASGKVFFNFFVKVFGDVGKAKDTGELLTEHFVAPGDCHFLLRPFLDVPRSCCLHHLVNIAVHISECNLRSSVGGLRRRRNSTKHGMCTANGTLSWHMLFIIRLVVYSSHVSDRDFIIFTRYPEAVVCS